MTELQGDSTQWPLSRAVHTWAGFHLQLQGFFFQVFSLKILLHGIHPKGSWCNSAIPAEPRTTGIQILMGILKTEFFFKLGKNAWRTTFPSVLQDFEGDWAVQPSSQAGWDPVRRDEEEVIHCYCSPGGIQGGDSGWTNHGGGSLLTEKYLGNHLQE